VDTDAASRFVQQQVVYNNAYRWVVRDGSSEWGAAATLLDQGTDAQVLENSIHKTCQDMRVSASVVIPWVDFGFDLNQRVMGLHEPPGLGVDGRGISFLQNRDPDDPHYPYVVRMTFDMEAQETELGLTDEREVRK